MSTLWEKTISAVLGLAALAIAVVELHREFGPQPASRNRAEYVADWRSMLPTAHMVGDQQAPITIIEFTDLQCPFCRRFNSALASARVKYPNKIATAFVHFPLNGHGQAEAAARAVECAAASGRFGEAVDFVFEKQDSLGKQPWTWFAAGAGVRDTLSFVHCMADSGVRRNVQAGLTLGKKIGVTGTPTVLLNGWRYSGTPSDTELVRAVGDLLSGKRPYKDFPKNGLPSRVSGTK